MLRVVLPLSGGRGYRVSCIIVLGGGTISASANFDREGVCDKTELGSEEDARQNRCGDVPGDNAVHEGRAEADGKPRPSQPSGLRDKPLGFIEEPCHVAERTAFLLG